MLNLRTVIYLLMLLVVSCTSSEETSQDKVVELPVRELPTSLLLLDPVHLRTVEVAPEVLAYWREVASSKPTLVLVSQDPMLASVPGPLAKTVGVAVKDGDADALRKRGTLQVENPLLVRDMVLQSALDAGFFSQVVWVVPSTGTGFDSVTLMRQLRESGIVSEPDVQGLMSGPGLVRGQLRGVPFRITPLENLDSISEPCVVHIDPSYFEKLYVNEIKTPLLSTLVNTLKTLREKHIKVVLATYNYANLERRVKLDVRSLGELLTTFFEAPDRLDKTLSEVWSAQGEILYRRNFIDRKSVMELATRMEELKPDSGWVQFSLYRAAQEMGLGELALKALDEAVLIDPVYGLEYENLAEKAYDNARPDEAVRMLKNAQSVFPGNPFLKLKLAQLYGELGDRDAAAGLIGELQTLKWSETYYRQIPVYLNDFSQSLQKNGQGQ